MGDVGPDESSLLPVPEFSATGFSGFWLICRWRFDIARSPTMSDVTSNEVCAVLSLSKLSLPFSDPKGSRGGKSSNSSPPSVTMLAPALADVKARGVVDSSGAGGRSGGSGNRERENELRSEVTREVSLRRPGLGSLELALRFPSRSRLCSGDGRLGGWTGRGEGRFDASEEFRRDSGGDGGGFGEGGGVASDAAIGERTVAAASASSRSRCCLMRFP